MPAPRPPIPLADYQRIFRVIKTVLDGAEAKTARSCVFFSFVGAYLVEQVYKKKCMPVAGAAFYKVDDEDRTVLTFADQDEEHDNASSAKGFHCWILCDGYIVDFMAPMFRESLRAAGFPGNCSRKMFQKPLSAMAESPLLIRKPGDFYLLPNVDLTRHFLQEFGEKATSRDLLDICMHWYRKPPKNIEPQLSMQSDDGTITHMNLSDMSLTGAW